MKTIQMTAALYDYLCQHQVNLHPILPDLIAETRLRTDGGMQIAPDQGAFMNQIVRLIGAKRILEVGCFTGYSSICLGLGLPENGELISCDINPETAAIARRYQLAAGLEKRARIVLGPAVATMRSLLDQYGAGSFDLIFLDADKESYADYYEVGLQLLRPNGLILADNVLWSGNVINLSDTSSATQALRNFNTLIRTDTRVEASMLSIADGLYLIRKRA